MALTVSDLPDAECPGGVWFIDVGLGSALYEPVPLREGTHRQGPFRYRLRASDVEPDGWRFDHDPRGQFVGMDFRRDAATVAEFAAMHEYLSTAPESGFVRVAVAQRRHSVGYDILRGLVLTRVGADDSTTAILGSQEEWYGVLADLFDLRLDDVSPDERARLWDRVSAAHAEYDAAWPASPTLTGDGQLDSTLTD
jgi:arylamine N-acetyltransferase